MKYLLDANAIIAILKGKPNLLARLQAHSPKDFGLPSIAAHELFYGAYKSQHIDANLARIEALQLETLAFDREDAQHAGEIRAQLAAAGTPIGPYDVLIAGQARARNLVLITHNMREFMRIPSLLMEDWES
ncbi:MULTISPECIES: type II toxin-antitoxin system VapC family toxin [Burkholderiaceae]|uniref:type II toxin-antitoxin system VapC family toxin n=1 Tax=Burkholderiaceae TaxID=119060 RepID=UPI000963174C|nr:MULTISPECIES: type II toxin-antitoxin system VapC family toxin [Burkholderiaceae]MCG1041004.1 type II toxin-antitoxin system VapC family toxin [Mycetohabitans sp. B7]SIT64848.1 tRNA(fMet)-specific endonuclease VapC [Burkholderia sp. b14]